MNNDVVLFTKNGKDITFEDLLLKIYENSEEKQQHLIATAEQVKPMIKTLQDAVIILPMLTDLQNTSVRNDEQLIKMAAIVQRGLGKSKVSQNPATELGISAEERQMLLEQAKELRKTIPGAAATD
jgi:hypothetical protein